MRNTGMVFGSSEKTPATAPAFSNLLPPLPDEQYAALEADILQNGCYSPVIVNEDHVIIDGHHRFEICEKHGVPYRIAVFSFEDDLEAKQWALDTQKARRSLTAWELGQIALKLKPEIEAKAAAKHAANGGDKKSSEAKSALTTLSKPISDGIDTRKELADAAGIGQVTMGKIMQINEEAPESVKTAMDDGMSVNAGYNIMRLLEKLPAEARDAAAQRAIELAKKRKGYKAAFDISIDDMNKLVKDDDEAAGAIRSALYEGGLSVNGGKDVAMTLLEMPEDVREGAAADADGLAELEVDYRKKTEAVDKNTEISKAYCAAFEKVIPISGSEREVRAWIEWAGIRKDEFMGLAEEAESAATVFTQIAAVLKKIHEREVAPYEDTDENGE